MRVIATVFLALSICLAQNPTQNDPYFTDGVFNGRHWQLLHLEGKTSYIMGLLHGLRDAGVSRGPYLAETLSLIDVVNAVDRFYQEPENLPLTIPQALRIVALKANGAPESEVSNAITTARRKALEAARKP